jgi:hypothetical protein
MYRREYHIVFPILLISIGALALMENAGLLAVSAWDVLLRSWPLLLVAWGLQGLLGRSALGALLAGLLTLGLGAVVIWYSVETGALQAPSLNSRTVRQALAGARDAEIVIDHSFGTLSIAALQDSPQLLEGTVTEGSNLSVIDEFRVVDGTAHYRLDSEGIGFLFQTDLRWDLNLSNRVPLDLTVHQGLGSLTVDLAELDVRQVSIDGGVGDIHVTAPGSGTSSLRIDQGVGSVRVVVPPNMEARLNFDGGLGGIQLDPRFREVGQDVYETSGYAGADDRVEIRVDIGVGELIVQ